jgi:hypothetical protein
MDRGQMAVFSKHRQGLAFLTFGLPQFVPQIPSIRTVAKKGALLHFTSLSSDPSPGEIP